MSDGNNSGVNTILIVILLVVVVGALVWFIRGGLFNSAAPEQNGLDVDVNLPTNEGGEEER